MHCCTISEFMTNITFQQYNTCEMGNVIIMNYSILEIYEKTYVRGHRFVLSQTLSLVHVFFKLLFLTFSNLISISCCACHASFKQMFYVVINGSTVIALAFAVFLTL